MSLVRAAIRLLSADPAAVTGLIALRRSMAGKCPAAMARYDLWDFEGGPGLLESVEQILVRYTDILNPNKQECFFLPDTGALPGEDPSLIWISVEVIDNSSSASETWTSMVARAGLAVSSVSCSVLWRLGFDAGLAVEDALAFARDVAVSTTRSSGLLSNPVSQSVRIRLACIPGEAAGE